MRSILFERHGGVRLVDLPSQDPEAGEVAIDVCFAGINPTDTYHRRRVTEGSDELDRVPGVEVAGTIAAIGPGVTKWSVGDRVFGLVHDGGLSDRVIALADLLAPIPSKLDALSAAAVPEAFTTAHDGILQGRFAAGETLLVSGASGAVGLAAVQIGLARGERVIGVCRSVGGQKLLDTLGAEAHGDHSISADTIPYRDSADVVIELVGALNARADLAALRARGRMVFIAAQGNEDITFNLRDFKTKRATLIGSTLRRRGLPDKIKAVQAFDHEVIPMLASGVVRPVVSKVFQASEARQAFEFMATPGKLGKVLLEFRP